MPVCRLRFQMELNLVRKKKNSKSHHWCCGSVSPGLPSNPAVLVLLCRFQLQWARGIRWEALNAFYSELRAHLMILFLPCKGTNSAFLGLLNVGPKGWQWFLMWGSPRIQEDPVHKCPFPWRGKSWIFFWVLFCKRNIVLVLTWSYHNCNKILKDFIIADWFLWF